jgi:DNA-binding CsgD family transcriptional regulator
MEAVGAAPGFFCDEAVIGTNSIGMAASTKGAVLVRGFEHYADAFTHITCASRAVVDPFTGQVLGVVNMTIADPAPWQLMTALVGRVVHETHQRLLDEAGSKSIALYNTFLQARRRAKGPLAAVDGSSFYANAAGSRLVASSDREALWAWAQRCVRQGAGPAPPLQLAFGTAAAECEAIYDGTQLIGAVVRFAAVPAGVLGGDSSGWARLTDAERSVAELVAAGYTNREAATTLFLSPHTVDYHLRHIFRKLDISSRIELARIAEQNLSQHTT